MFTRATLDKTNDDPKGQEVDVNLSHGEKHAGIEHVQSYGLSVVPVGATDEGGTKQRAEAIVMHPEGNRSHPIAIAIQDRRYRPQKMKPGEVQVHDNKRQKVHLGTDGITVESPKNITFKVGNSSIELTPEGIKLNGPLISMSKT